MTPVPGSRFADWVRAPFDGMHFCGYAVSEPSVAALRAAGVVVGATGAEAHVEVLEFPDHPFYVVSMFQPHIGASRGAPIHPLGGRLPPGGRPGGLKPRECSADRRGGAPHFPGRVGAYASPRPTWQTDLQQPAAVPTRLPR